LNNSCSRPQTKYKTETYYETKKVPVTTYTYQTYPAYKTKTEYPVEKKP
jgi:hypothetical protein